MTRVMLLLWIILATSTNESSAVQPSSLPVTDTNTNLSSPSVELLNKNDEPHAKLKKHYATNDNTIDDDIDSTIIPNDAIPQRYLQEYNNDIDLAKAHYRETLTWRQKEKIDTILSEPQPHFHLIKKHFPHYTHFRGKNNEVVYYECPPQIDLQALKEGGVTMDHLLRHYMMQTEFIWKTVEPTEDGRSIYVLDLHGARLRDFAGDVTAFIKQASTLCTRHYPSRNVVTFIVNVPYWFGVAWSFIKMFLSQTVLDRVKVVRGGDIGKVLSEHIDIENIPPVYGGLSVPLGHSPEEKMLSDVILKNNEVIGDSLQEL